MTALNSPILTPQRRAALSGAAYRIDFRVMLTVILILGLVARAWNLFGYPAFSDDEGTYVAQAWAVRNGLGLAHYTYIYDHPPLGWIQIAALSWIPTLVAPSLPAVAAGRIVMLVFAGVSIVLLYCVARRLRFSNWAALAATAVFAFSPLAIALHRQVFLDNIAVTWILVAFLLALSPRQHLGLQMLAGVTAAVSVLSKETLILAVPAILLALWQNSHPRTRNFATIGFVCGFVTTSAFYPLYALLKGELLWRDRDRVSMLEMLVYQLFGREGSGSVFDSQSQAYETLVGWSLQDAAILIVGTVSATVALFIRRLRGPALAATIPILIVAVRPDGYMPGMLVVQILPFFALTTVGVAQVLATALRSAAESARFRWVPGVVCMVAVALMLVVLPRWWDSSRREWTTTVNDPLTQAAAWFDDPHRIAGSERILTDDTIWLDLVALGYDPTREVLWHFKVDLDKEVKQQLTHGWQDLDYVVSTPTIRRTAGGLPTVSAALRNSRVVVAFGSGDDRVEIREISRP